MVERRPTRQQIWWMNAGKAVVLFIIGLLIVWLWLDEPTAVVESPAPIVTITSETVTEESEADGQTAAVSPEPTPFLTIPNELKAGTVILSGVAQPPGAIVEVLVDEQLVGETTVSESNTWTLAAEITAEGLHQLTTRVYEVQDGERVLTYEDSIEINVRTMSAPKLTLTGQERLQGGALNLMGEALPNTTVEILIDGEVVGDAVADENGRWLFVYTAAQAGTYELQLRMLAEDGAVLGESEPSTLLLEEQTAAAERLTVDIDDLPTLLLPNETITLTGTAAPESLVVLELDGVEAQTVTADEEGMWVFPITLPEADEMAVRLRVLDDAGDMVAVGDPFVLVLAPLPQPFVVEEPLLDEETAELSVSGTATPGSQVIVVLDGEPYGFAFVDDEGVWAVTLELPAVEGFELQLENRSAEGDYLLASELMQLSAAPDEETVSEAPTATAETVTPAVTETPFAGLVNNPLAISFPAEGSEIEDVLIRLLGTGPARRQIEFLDNGVVVGQTTVPDSGIWRYSFEAESGVHELSIRLLYENESEIAPLTVTLNRPPINPGCLDPEPGEDLGDRYIVGDCEWLIRIANRLGVSYQSLLDLNPELQENPNILRPGQVILLPPRDE